MSAGITRRGFLQRLAVASAAMAAASKAGVLSASPATKLCSAQQMVLDLLDECRVIAVSGRQRVDGVREYDVTYRRGSGTGVGEFSVPMPNGRMIRADQIRHFGVPKSMTIKKFIEDRAIDLNNFSRPILFEPVIEIIIEWVVT